MLFLLVCLAFVPLALLQPLYDVSAVEPFIYFFYLIDSSIVCSSETLECIRNINDILTPVDSSIASINYLEENNLWYLSLTSGANSAIFPGQQLATFNYNTNGTSIVSGFSINLSVTKAIAFNVTANAFIHFQRYPFSLIQLNPVSCWNTSANFPTFSATNNLYLFAKDFKVPIAACAVPPKSSYLRIYVPNSFEQRLLLPYLLFSYNSLSLMENFPLSTIYAIIFVSGDQQVSINAASCTVALADFENPANDRQIVVYSTIDDKFKNITTYLTVRNFDSNNLIAGINKVAAFCIADAVTGQSIAYVDSSNTRGLAINYDISIADRAILTITVA